MRARIPEGRTQQCRHRDLIQAVEPALRAGDHAGACRPRLTGGGRAGWRASRAFGIRHSLRGYYWRVVLRPSVAVEVPLLRRAGRVWVTTWWRKWFPSLFRNSYLRGANLTHQPPSAGAEHPRARARAVPASG